MKQLTLVAAAIILFMTGCPFDKRGGFDLSIRITELESNQVAGGVTVTAGFCPITREDCSTALTEGFVTDSEGIFSVAEPFGLGCPTPVSNRLVVVVDQGNDPEQIDIIVESTGQLGSAPGNDYVGAHADGDRFAVEVLECIDVGQPLSGS